MKVQFIFWITIGTASLMAADAPPTTTVQRQIIVEGVSNGVSFKDAIYLTEAEFTEKKADEIQAIAQARFDLWKESIKPKVDPRTEKQRLQDELTALAAEKTAKEKEAADLAVAVAAKQAELDAANAK